MALGAQPNSTTVTAPARGAKLSRPAGHGHHALLHVGLPHLPQRHPRPAPEIDLRPELRRGHSGPVLLLLGVRHLFDSLRQGHRAHRLPKNDGRRPADHGTRSPALHSRRQCSVVSLVSCSTHHSGCRHHRAAGCCQSLRRGPGTGSHRFQSAESHPGLQFARDHRCPILSAGFSSSAQLSRPKLPTSCAL